MKRELLPAIVAGWLTLVVSVGFIVATASSRTPRSAPLLAPDEFRAIIPPPAVVPSPERTGRLEQPEHRAGQVDPEEAPSGSPVPEDTVVRPSPELAPAHGRRLGAITGKGTWYRYVAGQAAAGPALRAALGPHWRGRTVRVCRGTCVTVRLTDWCACGLGRIIDLDVRSFARLADPGRGVIAVEVSW